MKTKSRLSKDLLEVLHDNAALAYFIQFMDAHKAKHLVKFWLEAESFRISLETKRKSQNISSKEQSSVHKDSSLSKSDNVFQDSSHAMGQSSEAHVKTCNQESVHIRNIYGVPVLSYKETSNLLNNDSSSSKSTKIETSLSVDSGCDDKVFANCVLKDLPPSRESSVTENEFVVGKANCDKIFSVSLELDQGIEVTSNKEEKSELLKDSIVRLETSK